MNLKGFEVIPLKPPIEEHLSFNILSPERTEPKKCEIVLIDTENRRKSKKVIPRYSEEMSTI